MKTTEDYKEKLKELNEKGIYAFSKDEDDVCLHDSVYWSFDDYDSPNEIEIFTDRGSAMRKLGINGLDYLRFNLGLDFFEKNIVTL